MEPTVYYVASDLAFSLYESFKKLFTSKLHLRKEKNTHNFCVSLRELVHFFRFLERIDVKLNFCTAEFKTSFSLYSSSQFF